MKTMTTDRCIHRDSIVTLAGSVFCSFSFDDDVDGADDDDDDDDDVTAVDIIKAGVYGVT